MKPDMVVSWDQHLKNGHVWKVNIELSMQGGDNDEQLFYTVMLCECTYTSTCTIYCHYNVSRL